MHFFLSNEISHIIEYVSGIFVYWISGYTCLYSYIGKYHKVCVNILLYINNKIKVTNIIYKALLYKTLACKMIKFINHTVLRILYGKTLKQSLHMLNTSFYVIIFVILPSYAIWM